MKHLLTSFILLFSFACMGQDGVEFKVVVPDTVPMGKAFKVTFTLENTMGTHFEKPDWSQFNEVGGPQQSTSQTFINGVGSSTQSYTYYIQATKEGTFTINPASILVDEKQMKTDWKKVVVIDGYELPKEQQRRRNPFDWNWDSSPTPPRTTPAPEAEEEVKKKKSKRKTYRI